jgi:single-strand DNA-binding protein
MDGLNQVTLMGSVGKDAESKVLNDGGQLASFSLATNRTYKTSNGEKKSKTEWHNIVTWGETAKFVGTYVKKGAIVAITGRIEYDEYEAKDGTGKRKATRIVAERVQLIPRSANGGGSTTSNGAEAKNEAAKQTEEYATSNQVTSESFAAGSDSDDLPF